MIKTRLLNRWLKALRSGEYTKVKYVLIAGKPADKTMSTLGVLIDVCDDTGWHRKEDKTYGVLDDGDYIFASFIPPQYLEVLGLTREEANTVAYENDMSDHTFEQIADVLEKYFSA